MNEQAQALALLERIAHAVEALAIRHVGDDFKPAQPSAALAPEPSSETAEAKQETGV